MKLNKDEMRLVRTGQKSINDAKRAVHDVAEAMGDLSEINYKEGRVIEGNAAMRMRGRMLQVLGSLIEYHADASDALHHGYEDGDSVIIAPLGGGGPRRRP